MISKFDSNNLPLDNVWLDIPYMNRFEDFTVDKVAFPTLDKLADSLHDNYRRIIPIIDAGLSADNKFAKYF